MIIYHVSSVAISWYLDYKTSRSAVSSFMRSTSRWRFLSEFSDFNCTSHLDYFLFFILTRQLVNFRFFTCTRKPLSEGFLKTLPETQQFYSHCLRCSLAVSNTWLVYSVIVIVMWKMHIKNNIHQCCKCNQTSFIIMFKQRTCWKKNRMCRLLPSVVIKNYWFVIMLPKTDSVSCVVDTSTKAGTPSSTPRNAWKEPWPGMSRSKGRSTPWR